MKKEIEAAVLSLAKKINGRTKPHDAASYATAIDGLTKALMTIQAIEQLKTGKVFIPMRDVKNADEAENS